MAPITSHTDPFCLPQILYTGKVSEDALPGLLILKVSATDPDVGSNAQITYSLHGPGAKDFRLDPHTGKMCTRCVAVCSERSALIFPRCWVRRSACQGGCQEMLAPYLLAGKEKSCEVRLS